MSEALSLTTILFVTGASGVGKTAALKHLASDSSIAPFCHFFDDIGVPSQEEMNVMRETGNSWQTWATLQWVKKLTLSSDPIAILEGQTKMANISLALKAYPNLKTKTLLLDCTAEARRYRLVNLRGQPELATDDMENWARFLRQEAKELGVKIIDTTGVSVEEVSAIIYTHAKSLMGL